MKRGVGYCENTDCEDYAKGVCSERVCQEAIQMAHDRGVPVFVDPAPRSCFSLYSGADLITPNRSEADRPVIYLTFSRIWYRDTLNP